MDVTNLGLHNKDFALVTQASILVIYIYIFAKIECKTLNGSRVHSLTIFPNIIVPLPLQQKQLK